MNKPIMFPEFQKMAKVDVLLEICNEYREEMDLGDDEFVVHLTGMANDLNWFSYGDNDANNIFIHTEGWDYFVGNDLRYPLTHQVATNVLQKLMFGHMKNLKAAIHMHSIGCINDFCQHKKDITLKMRTADICTDCQQILINEEVAHPIINQTINIIEGVRFQMLFKVRFKFNLQPSRMEVRSISRYIYLTDLEDFKVKLTPLERTVYLFFLDHPEGVHLNSLFEHEAVLNEIYGWLSSADIDKTIAAIHNSIKTLCNTLDNSLNEKISKANRQFVDAVGEDMAQHYMILKDHKTERYKIALDRNLLTYASSVRY